MMKGRIIPTAVIMAIFAIMATGAAFAESVYSGAAAKMPVPLTSGNFSLEKQNVDITVYSNFIEVDAVYAVKNASPDETKVKMGFSLDRNSQDLNKGEFPFIDLKVLKNKKEDYFVMKKIEGNEKAVAFKESYSWDMDLGGKKTTAFSVHYFVKTGRENGVPHFAYIQENSGLYSDGVGQSRITVNMPMNCEKMPIRTEKDLNSESFIYSSIPDFKIKKNIISWDLSGSKSLKNLDLYFYKNGFPDWEIVSGNPSAEKTNGFTDGDPATFWSSGNDENGGIDTWLEFKPVIRTRSGNLSKFQPRLAGIGIIPGNTFSLSDFYNNNQVREAEALIYDETAQKLKEQPVKTKKINEKRPPSHTGEKFKKVRAGMILLDCNADPQFQIFRAKSPLDTKTGPVRLSITKIYPGMKTKELCISEIFLFDRQPNELYEDF